MATILTSLQQKILSLLSKEQLIQQHFYLSGGTVLAQYYLQHRLSEDLDFFSMDEVDPKAIEIIFKKMKPTIKFQKVSFETSFNRNLFFLHFPNEVIKTEFTYYPFEQIEKPKMREGVSVDSLIDIAVNKTDTILTNPRTRDFIDLYLILQKEKWNFLDLVKQARIKFDMYVSPLHQVEYLLRVSDIKDFPHMIIPFDFKECEGFWLSEAKKLRSEVLQ